MRLLTIVLGLSLIAKAYGQTNPALEKILKEKFPESSTEDGRWVFYPEKAHIEKVEKPMVNAVLPGYSFYKMTLTNYLGYHVNDGTCVVLLDSLESTTVLVKPLWYSDISVPLIKLILKKQFASNEQLMGFLKELNDLMEIGSGYKFILTSSTNDLVTYDLVYFKGDSYTTGGNGARSTVNYTADGIWRQIEVRLKDLRIVEYGYKNPRLKNNKEYKDSYKKTIK